MTAAPVGEAGLPPLRDVIARYDLAAKRSLGQNFLLDLNLTRRIARLAQPLEGVTVVEIGPGPGGLTRGLLAEGAERVVAVERDARCIAALAEVASAYPNRLTVVEADALALELQNHVHAAGPVRIVANLPYNISTVLLSRWLEREPWPPWWDRMVLMFQKEVAQRLVAAPGSGQYGRLSVLAQWRTTPQIRLTLPPQAFTPAPKVDSSVVVFAPREPQGPACQAATLSRVTAAAFGQRRKMLRQSLARLLPDAIVALQALGIEPSLRAEALTIPQFCAIAAHIEAHNL
jgi:16S rRNA (adenine1518-N6/adenine1519-N6)-dimethyltransferase